MPHLNKPEDDDKSSCGNGLVFAANAAYTTLTSAAIPTTYLSNSTTMSTTLTGNAAFSKKVTVAEPPASWTKIQTLDANLAYLEAPEIYESPANGRQVHMGSLTISNQASRHHWEFFKKLHPDIDYLIVGVAHDEKNNHVQTSNVMFLDEQSAQVFERWLDDYLQYFDNDRAQLYSYRLPPPPRTMHYSVQVHFRGQEDLVDFAVWMRENCHQQAFYLGGMLFFQNDEDAMLYKMKFEGK